MVVKCSCFVIWRIISIFFYENKDIILHNFLLLFPLFNGCHNDKAYITLLVTDIHRIEYFDIIVDFNITVDFLNFNFNHRDDSSKSGWTP